MDPTPGLRVVLGRRAQIEQALGEAKYHRIIHVRNAAQAALREVRPRPTGGDAVWRGWSRSVACACGEQRAGVLSSAWPVVQGCFQSGPWCGHAGS